MSHAKVCFDASTIVTVSLLKIFFPNDILFTKSTFLRDLLRKIPHLVLSSHDGWSIPFNTIEGNFRKLDDIMIVYKIGMHPPEYVSNEIKNFVEDSHKIKENYARK